MYYIYYTSDIIYTILVILTIDFNAVDSGSLEVVATWFKANPLL